MYDRLVSTRGEEKKRLLRGRVHVRRVPTRRTISRSRDSGLRYNSPLSMEILNRTKQQYISQNYVIPRACAYTVCNMR